MDPNPIAGFGQGYIGGLFDHHEMIVLVIGEELANVNVDVTLRALDGGIQRDAPSLIAPGFAGLGHGGCPISGALFRRHFEKLLRMAAVKAGKREPAVRFGGVGIAQKEVLDVGGLFLGFFAESALAGFEGSGDRDIAEALANVGARHGQ